MIINSAGSYSYVLKGTYNGAIVAKKVFKINCRINNNNNNNNNENNNNNNNENNNDNNNYNNNNNNNNNSKNIYMREIEIWNRIKPHPFILQFYGAYHYNKNENPFIVSEYCNNGTVKSYTSRDNITVNQKLQIMHDITIGIYHLHQSNVIHGDIKSDNILISNDGTPKICDFGLSIYLSDK